MSMTHTTYKYTGDVVRLVTADSHLPALATIKGRGFNLQLTASAMPAEWRSGDVEVSVKFKKAAKAT